MNHGAPPLAVQQLGAGDQYDPILGGSGRRMVLTRLVVLSSKPPSSVRPSRCDGSGRSRSSH